MQYMELDYNPSTYTAEMLPNLICKMYLDIVDKQIDWYLTEYLDPHNGQMGTPFFSCYRTLNSMMNIFSKCQTVPMGASSGSICNLVVHELEKKILQSPRSPGL